MDLDAYVRVSRVDGRSGESFISPAVQRERCEGIAQAGGHRIVNVVEDLDESGGRADRPGFQQVLARIEAGETEGIVVARLDRFARSVADAATAMKRIEAADGALMVAESALDTSTSFGRFAMHMMLAMAELELDRIRENWDSARARAVARGVHVASRTPTGYSRDESKRLVPNDDAPVVTRLFEMRAQGASWGELADLLESADVLTPYGARFWTPGSIGHLLRNRVYLGEARSGKHVAIRAHTALTDPSKWRAAQKAKQRPTQRSGDFLLSGLLRCAGCRYALKPSRMKDRDGTKLRMYSCRGKKAGGKCPTPTTILARIVEPYVIEQFMERAGDAAARAVEVTEDVEALQHAVDVARAERDAYLEADISDIVGVERYRAELERRTAILEAAEDELSAATQPTTDLPDAKELRRIWPDLSLEEQRQLLSLGIDCIFLRRPPRQGLSAIDGRVLIAWRGEGPDDLPGRGPIPVIRSVSW